MHDFLVKKLSNTNIEQELINIGFDKTYTHTAKDKFEYINFKIFNLTPAQANIIKQINGIHPIDNEIIPNINEAIPIRTPPLFNLLFNYKIFSIFCQFSLQKA